MPTYKGPIYCLNKYSGEIIWENTDSEYGYWDSSPTIKDSIIYIGGRDGCLHAYNVLNGTTEWETYIGSVVESTPAIMDDIICVGCSTYNEIKYGKICAVDRFNGNILWSIVTNLHGSIGIAENIIYWCEHFGDTIFAANALSGDIIWFYKIITGAHGMQSSPAIVDGVMYIAATDGFLYAFGSGIKYCYEDQIITSIGNNELIVKIWDLEGNFIGQDTSYFTVGLTNIDTEVRIDVYKLFQNYPNLFNPTTILQYRIPEQSDICIMIYDLLGRYIKEWNFEKQQSGVHNITWDGTNTNNQKVSTGIYIYKMVAGNYQETKKMVFIK